MRRARLRDPLRSPRPCGRASVFALALALVGGSACARTAAPVGNGDEVKHAASPEAPTRDAALPDVGPTSALVEPDATDGASTKKEPMESAPPGMARVPGGSFRMGTDDEGQEDERPAHVVTLASFFLDRTEVTNEAYDTCVAEGSCHSPNRHIASATHAGPDSDFSGPKQPVVGVRWDDAKDYCASVGKRLPREAEFERAIRGDDGRRYPWGNEPPTAEHTVFGRPLGRGGVTDDVGSHPRGRGPYGHDDLAGNVWEWMEDLYDPLAYSREGARVGTPGTCEEILETLAKLRREGRRGFTGSNPIPTTCERVLRGGAFNYDRDGLRSTNRVHHPGSYRLVMSGFRCAKDAHGT